MLSIFDFIFACSILDQTLICNYLLVFFLSFLVKFLFLIISWCLLLQQDLSKYLMFWPIKSWNLVVGCPFEMILYHIILLIITLLKFSVDLANFAYL